MGSTTAAHPVQPRRWRRRILLALVMLVPLLALWLGLGLRSAANAVQAEASAAQTSIEKAKAQLVAGDVVAAKASAQRAQVQVADASAAADVLPVTVVGLLPMVGAAVDDLTHLISAAGDLAAASSELVDVYAAATGNAGGATIFSQGKADFEVMAGAGTSVDKALHLASRARDTLGAVQGTLPGTGSMAAARDKALAQVNPLVDQLTTVQTVLAGLPDAMGRTAPKNYLVVTLNPAELFGGGGAALSAAVLRFTDGRMSLPIQGSVSTKLFPKNPTVPWDHISSFPYYKERQAAAFAWSNLHPDFAVTAQEMQRAWVANGQKQVDGVIALDPIALAAVLRTVGPVQTAEYGKVTGDNLVRKLLVDAYGDFSANQDARHDLNDSLMTSVFSRLSGGDGAFGVAKALASTSGGEHFRIHLNDPTLQRAVDGAGLSGRLPAADQGDAIAVFSQNQNSSKVDIFQKRDISHDVVLAADGSAKVTTTATFTYDVPAKARTSTDRIGYLTRWSYNWYYAYLPVGAQLVSYESPRGDRADAPADPNVYDDLNGWRLVRVGRWTAAGASTAVTLVYTFPAGTFLRSGELVYRLRTVSQAMVHDPQLAVTVTAPATATVRSSMPSEWTVSDGRTRWGGLLSSGSDTSMTFS